MPTGLADLLHDAGDSDEVDQHSAVMPINVPGGSDQSSERSDAGFCILLKVIAIVKLVVVAAVGKWKSRVCCGISKRSGNPGFQGFPRSGFSTAFRLPIDVHFSPF
jgi:hypothetical protein